MNIYALPGHKVVVATFSAGYDRDKELAKQYLKEGQEYTIDHTEVSNWYTDVYLEEFPNRAFNSVFFEDVQPQSVEDDMKHPDYYRYHHK